MGTKKKTADAETDEPAVADPVVPTDPVSGKELQSGDKVQRADGDLGVPMLAGDSSEPTGPEDALGEGPKRGDYTDRVNPRAHEGTVPQAPRAEDIGDEPGVKGGVDTADV
jgi:hypothetical protein